LITSFVGETGSNLQKVLSLAEQSPMVLLLDEADAIAKARDDANDVGELRRVVNSLLQGLDSVAKRRSLVILASNHSHLFDPAIWRRFDEIVEFPLPSQSERILQLKHLTSGLKLRAENGWMFGVQVRVVPSAGIKRIDSHLMVANSS
jgi:SpoVK/Ycf46/Vps4 family AAA+-type ATPase